MSYYIYIYMYNFMKGVIINYLVEDIPKTVFRIFIKRTPAHAIIIFTIFVLYIQTGILLFVLLY